ncbi:MAG: hypothetical protein ACXVZM_02210, partial [Terriglobales bacterium]
AGDVEQKHQQARGTDLDEIVKIATDAGAAVERADAYRGQVGELGGSGKASFGHQEEERKES